jgi:hypothetical protein
MNFFRSCSDGKIPSPKARSRAKVSSVRARFECHPELEALEDRFLPSCNTISGYVFYDANNNGLMDPGEPPIANSRVELRNINNQVVASAITDANGFYQFSLDATVSTAVQTLTRTLTFPSAQTNFTVSGLVGQFDPSLGKLVSIDITNAGSITSDIYVENTSATSPSIINATVGGKLTLTGPTGVAVTTLFDQNAGTFNASTFDGKLDFAGTSGVEFGAKTANGSQALTLSGDAINPFVGTGYVVLTESGTANSTATGGGNLLVGVTSTGAAQVTVAYKYIPSNCLKPGSYAILKTSVPPGYIDGKESSNGVVLSYPPGVNVIPATMTNSDLKHNDFAELLPSSISGHVYLDTSPNGFNNGIIDPGEPGIGGVVVTLTGNDDLGPVARQTATNPDGTYQFAGLRPGSYTVTKTHPAGYIDGKSTVGSLGGQAAANVISGISLPTNVNAHDYNFGELTPVISASNSSPPELPNTFAPKKVNIITPPVPVVSKAQLLAIPDSAGNTVIQSDARFINAMYNAILGRDADPGGLGGWLIYLRSGGTRAGAVDLIWHSDENRIRQITGLYLRILAGPPTQDRLSYYLNLFHNGASEVEVAANIATSPEAYAKFADNGQYLNMLFDIALGRSASSAEQTTWLSRGLSRHDLAIAIMNSPESIQNVVTNVYRDLLARDPEAGAIDAWVQRLQAGMTFSDLVRFILLSNEFARRVG